MNVCMLLDLLIYIYLHWYVQCTSSVPATTDIQMRLPLFICICLIYQLVAKAQIGSCGCNAVGLYFGVYAFSLAGVQAIMTAVLHGFCTLSRLI